MPELGSEEQPNTQLDMPALAAEVAELRARLDEHDDVIVTSFIETASIMRGLNHLKRLMRGFLSERAEHRRRAVLQSDPSEPDANHEDYVPGERL